jgi:hypothetical protein
LVARGLAGCHCPTTGTRTRIDLADENYVRLIGGALLAAHPLPDTAEPTNQHDLAQLLRRLADTFAAALPKP